MSDESERLRERTRQVAALSQTVDALQAQLAGAQKRAAQLGEEVQRLQSVIGEKDAEIMMLRGELERTKSALTQVGKEVRGMKMDQIQLASKRAPGGEQHSMREELEVAQRTAKAAKEDVRALSEAATAVLNNEEGALEVLRKTVLEVGDPKYRVLNMVLQKRRVKVEEVAAVLVSDTTAALSIIDELQSAGEVELRDGNMVIPAKKYREVEVPVDQWQTTPIAKLFDELESVVSRTDGHESVAKAIAAAVDIIEQRLPRAGALVFQMRKTANQWKVSEGSIDELRYTIRDWKSRAQALS
ncbi:MAG: hypothetical protein HXY34_11235 [Candidatus Thorarchaeota archaeon]|nr:hypothetical protein [Candidatus Thorarchaeota archaeon]